MSNQDKGGRVAWQTIHPGLDHPVKRAIVAALEDADEPLTASELLARVGDSQIPLSRITYHADLLVEARILVKPGEVVAPDGMVPLYFFASES